MKKRYFWVTLLLLSLFLTFLPPTTAQAAVSGTCGDHLTWSLDDAGTLTISGEGAIPDYLGTGIPWGQYHAQIKRIVISEGVTGIGKNAFAGWVGIPNPYESYPNLEEIIIPTSITAISSSAFAANSGLKSIRIPGNVKEIGEYAFDECFALTEVILEPGIEKIHGYAFNACSMPNISLPDTLVSIGDQAFSNNPALQTVVIPEGVQHIGLWAFVACPQLHSITIPKSVTDLGSGTFHSCPSLTSIQVNPDNPKYISVDNVLYSKDKTHLHTVGRGISGQFNLPGTVTTIEEYALEDCKKITGMVIPNSVTEILPYAFAGCTGLAEVVWPESMTTIKEYTFNGCSGLKRVVFPDNLQSIGNAAFAGCSALTSIEIPDSVTSIGHAAFNSCKGLQNVKLPATIKSLAPSLFRFCTSLTSITIPETVTFIGEYALSSTALTQLEIPKNVTSVRQGALASCDSLKVVVFMGNAPSMHKIAFDGTSTAIFYPKSNATWTPSVRQNYGGSLTWTAGIPCENGHSFGEWKLDKPATCTDSGNQRAECAICGRVRNQAIPVIAHSYVTDVISPTCTEAGCTVYTCEVCGHNDRGNHKEPTGHSYGPWTNATGEAKLEERICVHCGTIEQRTLETPVSPPNAPDSDEPDSDEPDSGEPDSDEPDSEVPRPSTPAPTQSDVSVPPVPSTTANQPSGADSHNSPILIVVLAALGGIALGVVVTVMVLKKKK